MSNTKTIADLREHLFATLAALRDPVNPMDIERARAISDVAQTMINSAKVEVEYAKAIGAETIGTEFLTADPPDDEEEPEAARTLRMIGGRPAADHPWRT